MSDQYFGETLSAVHVATGAVKASASRLVGIVIGNTTATPVDVIVYNDPNSADTPLLHATAPADNTVTVFLGDNGIAASAGLWIVGPSATCPVTVLYK